MIAGRVTSRREATVPIQVWAADGSTETVGAVVDTGFTGFLALPSNLIAALELPLTGLQRSVLADDSSIVLLAYGASVRWHGVDLVVKTLEVERSALVGMSLLEGSLLTMQVTSGGPVRIEPMRRIT